MGRRLTEWLRRRPFDLLLALLTVMVFAADSVRPTYIGRLLVAAVAAGMPMAAIVAIAESRTALRLGLLLGLPAAAGITQHALGLHLVPAWIVLTCPLAMFLLASWVIVRHVARAPRGDANLVRGGTCGYLMIGYTFGIAYSVADYLQPAAFLVAGEPSQGALAPGVAVYFSFITLTTVGYGDIVPLSPLARSLVVLEALIGVLYLAIIVSRLVTAQSDDGRPQGGSTQGC